MVTRATSTTLAFSYIRFSHPEQSKGDSLRRQTEETEAYCARRGWTLSPKTYQDLGVSAMRGKNALIGNLGEFLKAIGTGQVPAGSVLIVESLDRITRQGVDEGLDLIKRILKSGINIITLLPEREFSARSVKRLADGLLEIMVILERAAEESERKSDRLTRAWREKQKRARAGEKQLARMGDGVKFITRQLPLWIREKDGKLELIPERAKIVRWIFELAASGYGFGLIVKTLKAADVPPFRSNGKGHTKGWLKQYVAEIVSDRRAIGEYQPRRGRQPDGNPIPGYFPAAVSEEEWELAREGAVQRRHRPGRVGEHVNLFSGLLWNARDKDTYIASSRYSGRRPGHPGVLRRMLVTTSYAHGRGPCWSFPHNVFEMALLQELREVKPADILNPPQTEGDKDAPQALVEKLEKELAKVDTSIATINADLDRRGESETLLQRLRAKGDQKEDLLRRLTEAKLQKAQPLPAAWGEMKTLLETLATAPDPADARLRLRAVLHRIIKSIWLLVVPRGRYRLCEVLILFHDACTSAYRGATIFYRAPKNNQHGKGQPACWDVVSHAQPRGCRPGWPNCDTERRYLEELDDDEAFGTAPHGFHSLDLRDLTQAQAVQGMLENYPDYIIAKLLSTHGRSV
jgi:DNA invertase Pin-like site-specific DNA recombinase